MSYTTNLGEKATAGTIQADTIKAKQYNTPTIYLGTFDDPSQADFTIVEGVYRYVLYTSVTEVTNDNYGLTYYVTTPVNYIENHAIKMKVNIITYPIGSLHTEVITYALYVTSTTTLEFIVGTLGGVAGTYVLRAVIEITPESQ